MISQVNEYTALSDVFWHFQTSTTPPAVGHSTTARQHPGRNAALFFAPAERGARICCGALASVTQSLPGRCALNTLRLCESSTGSSRNMTFYLAMNCPHACRWPSCALFLFLFESFLFSFYFSSCTYCLAYCFGDRIACARLWRLALPFLRPNDRQAKVPAAPILAQRHFGVFS